ACGTAGPARLGQQRAVARSDPRAVQSERVRVYQVTAMKTCKTCWSRRDFLFRSGGGVSGLALAYLLNQDKLLAGAPAGTSAACGATPVGFNPYAPKPPH